jgi:DHA1 family bicyclomycin/chloramphenicol resistance-like MFS transporter
MVVPRAIVRDLYDGEGAGRELSRIGAVMSVAPVIAPLLGGAVHLAFGWHANFLAVLAVGMLAAVLTLRSMPETLQRRFPEGISMAHILRSYRAVIGQWTFLALALSCAGLFAWISGSPLVLQDLYGLSAFGFAVAFAVGCIGTLAGAALAASVVGRIGLDATIGIGSLALAGGGLAMVVSMALGAHSVTSFVLSAMLFETEPWRVA